MAIGERLTKKTEKENWFDFIVHILENINIPFPYKDWDKDNLKVAEFKQRLKEVNIDWLTVKAEAAGISRSGFLDKLLDSLRTTESSVGDTGLFDVYSNQMEKLIDELVEQRVKERTR